MTAELTDALLERECCRVEAAATWLHSTGMPLVELYEVLLAAALRTLPPYATTPAEHVASWEVQECVRDLVARLSPRQRPGDRGQVLIVVPGGSRWVLGTAALSHVLEDAGFATTASPDLDLADVTAVLDGFDRPTGLCIAVHDVAHIPQVREVVRKVRATHPAVRVVVGGKAEDAVTDLGSLVGAHAVSRRLSETLAALGEQTSPLSPRELAVLECVARGMSNPDAGQALGVASATVKTHLDRVYAKLGTSDRTATVALAMRRGWID
jgi:DNA-binding CsgD family transcriptional regulator